MPPLASRQPLSLIRSQSWLMLLLTCWNEVCRPPKFCSAAITVLGPTRAADKQARHELIKVNVSPPRPMMSCGTNKNTILFFSLRPTRQMLDSTGVWRFRLTEREPTCQCWVDCPFQWWVGGALSLWSNWREEVERWRCINSAQLLLPELNEGRAFCWNIYQVPSAGGHKGRNEDPCCLLFLLCCGKAARFSINEATLGKKK